MTATEIALPPFEADKGEPLDPPPPPPETPELPPRRTRRKTKGVAGATAPASDKDTPQPEPVTASISDDDKQALAGLLTTGFGICFEIIAARRGEHWRLTKEEAQRLGVAWGEPLAPFLARHSQYVPWAVALLATSGVLMPRLAQDSSKLAEAENAGTAQTT